MLTWDKNDETDLAGFIVAWGTISGNYSQSYTTEDTTIQIFIPDSLKTDSLFFIVSAFDESGNLSESSRELAVIPEVLKMNMVDDENKRIDVEDLRKYLELYRKHFGKTIWRYTN